MNHPTTQIHNYPPQRTPYLLAVVAVAIFAVMVLTIAMNRHPDPLPPTSGVPPEPPASPVVVVVNVPPQPTGIYWLLPDEPTPTPSTPSIVTPVPRDPTCETPVPGQLCQRPTKTPPPPPTRPTCEDQPTERYCRWATLPPPTPTATTKAAPTSAPLEGMR